MDYDLLRSEILTDPVGLGYSGKTRQEQSDLMNDSSLSSYEKFVIPSYRIQSEVMDLAELDALDSSGFNRLMIYLRTFSNEVDIASPNIQALLGRYIGANSLANARSIASCSRSERLFGREMSAHMIEKALGEL